MNQAFLSGNVVKDPDVRQTKTGKKVAVFTLAVNEATGTLFMDIVAWETRAEIAEKHLKKGDRVSLSGRISKRTYEDRNGVKRERVEVVANDIVPPKKDTAKAPEPVGEPVDDELPF